MQEVPEHQIDAISSLIGCSIAWYQIVIEAMADGGVKNGVSRALAYKMVAKAMEGAAKLVLETGNTPSVVSSYKKKEHFSLHKKHIFMQQKKHVKTTNFHERYIAHLALKGLIERH